MTDYTTSAFFANVVDSRQLISSLAFDNAKRIFPSVHPDTPFTLLTMGSADGPAEFTSYILSIEELEDPRRHYSLSPEEIALINPNTKTAPIFRAREDAKLTAKIYGRIPVLFDQQQSRSAIEAELIQNFFSGSNREDQILFEAATRLPQIERVGVYRGTMAWQFDHRYATYRAEIGRFVELTDTQKFDPYLDVASDKYVAWSELQQRYNNINWNNAWCAGWRDITNATNERTVISAILPLSASDDTFSIILPRNGAVAAGLIVANLNSLLVDFIAQRKVGGTHIRKFIIQQLPILPLSSYSGTDLDFIVLRVLELTYTSHSMAPFAHDLGYDGPPFAWDEERRAELRAELDAWYALAYGLSRKELRYVLDPKDVMGEDYPSETFRVLQKNEIARYGEYRTRRLVLAAYDRLVAAAPVTDTVSDGAWQHQLSGEIDMRHLLAGLLTRMRDPKPVREVVYAMLFAAKPHLLIPYLDTARQAEWRRLIGPDANLPTSTVVVGIASGHLGTFAQAKARLAAERALRFDASTQTWDRGAPIYDYTLPAWCEGRADFVWHALQTISLDSVQNTLPQEERDFISFALAA